MRPGSRRDGGVQNNVVRLSLEEGGVDTREPAVLRRNFDSRLFPKLSDGGVREKLPSTDSAAREIPPISSGVPDQNDVQGVVVDSRYDADADAGWGEDPPVEPPRRRD